MFRLLIFLLLLQLLTANIAGAQVATVTGKAVDLNNGGPLDGANVMVLKGDSLMYHTVTDSTGRFSIPAGIYQQMDYLRITYLNYQDFKLARHPGSGTDMDLGVLQLKPVGILLKEVKVTSAKRYTDTSKIDLSKRKFERSVMIDDLFNQFGFSKDQEGHLFYKGKPVSSISVNGESFFGKNNHDVYTLLPALVLDNIQVVETNIDTMTNVTQLKPTVKVDLKFKDKYAKGKFGHANAGAGTTDRYLLNTDLFTYRRQEQVSLTLGSNNINAGQNLITPPSVSFSAGGNDILSHSAKLTYHNVFRKKLDVDLTLNGLQQDKVFTAQVNRNDQDINQVSHTVNKSNLKEFHLNDSFLTLNYHLDPLTTITLNQIFNLDKTNLRDSANYDIRTDTLHTISDNFKIRRDNTNTSDTKVTYLKKSAAVKGRFLSLSVNYVQSSYHSNETDNVYNLNNEIIDQYMVEEKIHAGENTFSVNADYTEPTGLDGNFALFAGYKNDRMSYNSQANNDSLINQFTPSSVINNQYIRAGIRAQHTFSKIELNGMITGILNYRDINQANNRPESIFRPNMDFKADFKLSAGRSLNISYSYITNFPGLNQLSNIGSTYDLVSQTAGNINLKPEDKQSFKTFYSVSKPSGLSLTMDAELDYYTDKFGFNVTQQGKTPITSQANVGDAKTGNLGFSLSKALSAKYSISSNTSISYQEQPSIVNGLYTLNNGVTLNESLSTVAGFFSSKLEISPLVTASLGKFFYSSGSANVLNITYSGKTSYNLAGYQLVLYPLINYSYSVVRNTSFSLNGEVRKSVLKDKIALWLQGYDLLNSFKFYNTIIGPTYTETSMYSNLHRYIFIGASFKFNNMK